MNYEPGVILAGKYKIVSELGGGAMGKLYKAENISLHKEVAIKIMQGGFAGSEEYRVRFMREATAAASLNHFNICTVLDYDVGEDGSAYIVMEYLVGETLAARIRRVGVLPPLSACIIMRQLINALACAHQKGIVHRDVKPDNIFLVPHDGRDDFVKLIDFGVAHIEHPITGEDAHLTQSGQVYGTPQYISPEQANGIAVDYRADLYAAGIIFYEMLVGTPPFQGKSSIALLIKQVNEPAPHLPESLVQSDRLDAIIQRLLEKDPENRFSSSAEITARIDEVIMLLTSTMSQLNPVEFVSLSTQTSAILTPPRTATNAGGGNATSPGAIQAPAEDCPAIEHPQERPAESGSRFGFKMLWCITIVLFVAVIALIVYVVLGKGPASQVAALDASQTKGDSGKHDAEPQIAQGQSDAERAKGPAANAVAPDAQGQNDAENAKANGQMDPEREGQDGPSNDAVARDSRVVEPAKEQEPPAPERIGAAVAPAIPALLPEPEVTVPPEERLQFKKSVKTKKGSVEYLIFQDSLLKKPCYIAVHNHNIQAQDDNRYCIPFSGKDKELTHPLAVTKTAAQYENYTYCAANLDVEKMNIPGLAGFFRAFNPTYYASDLARFIDEPFQVHKPKEEKKSKHESSGTSYFLPAPNLAGDEACASEGPLIPNPFITLEEYQKYNLAPGVVFLTASAAKGEKVLHQYWQIITGVPQSVCVCAWESFDNCDARNEEGCSGGSGGCGWFEGDIVQINDLSSPLTYALLKPQILAGMPARDAYCEAVNRAFMNEARAGNWARVDNDSPLMKMK